MEQKKYFQRHPDTERISPGSIIELFSLEKGNKKRGTISFHTIIFLLKGSCWFSSDFYPPQLLEEGYAIFLPLKSCYDFTAQQNCTFLFMQGDLFQKIKGGFSLETLYYLRPENTTEQTTLPVNPLLKEYLKLIENFLISNFHNSEFFDLKIQELHILLTKFYTHKELAGFFLSVLNSDLAFANFVLNNWDWGKSVQELVKLSHYCETGFRKKFQQVFGQSPYKWIQQKRSARLYYEIVNNNKPFKAIAEEYGFKSLQHFNEYCHRYFNCTPGQLRKSNIA